jgi:hypothetical protein
MPIITRTDAATEVAKVSGLLAVLAAVPAAPIRIQPLRIRSGWRRTKTTTNISAMARGTTSPDEGALVPQNWNRVTMCRCIYIDSGFQTV